MLNCVLQTGSTNRNKQNSTVETTYILADGIRKLIVYPGITFMEQFIGIYGDKSTGTYRSRLKEYPSLTSTVQQNDIKQIDIES